MSVCVEVSEPKSYPLFPAVLTAGLVTLVQISRVLPLLLSPAAQDCRGQPSCTGTSTLLTAHCTLCNCIITMIIMVLVCLAWIWCVVLRWTVCLQARDVSVVRVTAGRAAEAGTVVAEADVIWSQYRRWRPAANMAVTSEKTGKGSLMRPRLFTLRLRSHFYV